MDKYRYFDNTTPKTNEPVFLDEYFLKNTFNEWLSLGNNKNYASTECIACFDRISEYVISKKIFHASLWSVTKQSVFKSIYEKVLNAKLLRITDNATYKLFIIVGKLYLRFLNDKAFIRKADIEKSIIKQNKKDINNSIQPNRNLIDPEDVIAWLITQPNVNGTLYLEHVARQYINALQSTPLKLNTSLEINVNQIFSCKNVDEFRIYWNIFKCAPNYKQVNDKTSGAFSAGMACYMRYLEHFSNTQKSVANYKHAIKIPNITTKTENLLDSILIDKLSQILSERFKNGYRLNSPIELSRFRSFVSEDLKENISLTDDDLMRHIASCGTYFDGKIYTISVQTKAQIKELAQEYFVDGAKVIFYSEFYAKHESWLLKSSIVSEGMLIVIFKELFKELSFTKLYFGYLDVPIISALECELLRVWGDDLLLTYDQLAERLKYIPIERIKYALGQSNEFIWNSLDTFTHINKIDISDDERLTIYNMATEACNSRGYTSIANLILSEFVERKHELSETAIYNGVFQICLSDEFEKRGKIVTRKGDVFDTLTIIKEYCRGVDKCSLDDLMNYEKEVTLNNSSRFSLEAGSVMLVRIDRYNYVADRYVHFNVEEIDAAIENTIKGNYLPIKEFMTFAAFPDCGQPWNLFVLESYCRRFSYKFYFDAPSVNSRNTGAVIRKNCELDYTEIMADAVAKSNISLTENLICRFLFESGYIGRSTTSRANEIIDKAKIIRERRG